MSKQNGKWHISLDGIPRPCTAKGPCPLGADEPHFATKEEAQVFYDKKSEKQHGLLPNMEAKPAEERLDDLHDELVPRSGKAPSVAGELVRAMSRVRYRFYNDGDRAGVGYGIETCNSSLRYIEDMAGKLDNGEDLKATVEAIWFTSSDFDDANYEGLIDDLAGSIAIYIENNPELRDSPNEVDSTMDFILPTDEADANRYYGDEEDEGWVFI